MQAPMASHKTNHSWLLRLSVDGASPDMPHDGHCHPAAIQSGQQSQQKLCRLALGAASMSRSSEPLQPQSSFPRHGGGHCQNLGRSSGQTRWCAYGLNSGCPSRNTAIAFWNQLVIEVSQVRRLLLCFPASGEMLSRLWRVK